MSIIDVMEAASKTIQDLQYQLGYIPIYTSMLTADSILDFDLYLFDGKEMVLFRSAKLPLTSEFCRDMIDRNLNRLYVNTSQRSEYQRYIRKNISRIISDDTVDNFTKSSIIYDCAKELIRDIFADPTKPQLIEESQTFVESTVLFVLEGDDTFRSMLGVMSFDYTVFTHSVNVCTFSLALGHSSGIARTNELIDLATGALLHDVGKAKIPEEILNKPGPLTESEWQMIREHPQWGVELMSYLDLIPQSSYIPIAQHHERLNGKGYPKGLCQNEIHQYGRIVAIADVFDAMTTNRVYQHAESTFSTLKQMSSQEGEFDESLLRQFIQLLGPIRPDLI